MMEWLIWNDGMMESLIWNDQIFQYLSPLCFYCAVCTSELRQNNTSRSFCESLKAFGLINRKSYQPSVLAKSSLCVETAR